MNIDNVKIARWQLADTAAHFGWTVNMQTPGSRPDAPISCTLYRDGVRITVEWCDDNEPTGCKAKIEDSTHPTITIPLRPDSSAQNLAAGYSAWRRALDAIEADAQALADDDVIDLREFR